MLLNQMYFDSGKNQGVFVFVLCRQITFRHVRMKVGGALLIGCDKTCLAAPIRSQSLKKEKK